MNPDFGNKTKLNIDIVNLQIIGIGSHALTLSMDMIVTWLENRLLMNVPFNQIAYIKRVDQKNIWSAEIFVAKDKVLERRENEEFGFMRLPRYLGNNDFGKKKFYLYTKVTCAMDFENFPFDNHVCNLEVS